MIILSDASVQSHWVEREVNAAREREDIENRTVLFPIRIDDAVMSATKAWAADIRRSRQIGDFRGWKHHDSYVKARLWCSSKDLLRRNSPDAASSIHPDPAIQCDKSAYSTHVTALVCLLRIK